MFSTSSPAYTDDITHDHILGGRIRLMQPKNGYRVAIDPIFLAASLTVLPGETVLDVGAGVGAASLALAARVPECQITGLEVQREYLRLGNENILQNNLRHRVEMLWGNLVSPPPRIAAGTFAHVMANPPYLEEDKTCASGTIDKTIAHAEALASLQQWIRFCLLMIRPKGTITFIHRADRLDEILTQFHGRVGDVKVYPLWPGIGKPAKRVLIKGKSHTKGPMTLLPGMVLHHPTGGYTNQADEILRNGAAIEW